MKINSIKRTIQNTKRLAEIISVLTRFGFRQVIVDSGLARLLDLKKEESSEVDAGDQPRSVRVRMALEVLGPTFIKLGQILSTRPDLIPPEWAKELEKLQDRCTPVPFSEIYEVLNLEFAGRLELLFSWISEEPLAAASMAQVHRARFHDGNDVVIKVIRPGNRQLVEEDMGLLQTMAHLVEQYFSDLGYNPVLVAQELSRELLKEVNLVYEGQTTDRLRRYFEDDENIFFPLVYWEATSRNVLTMEEIKGHRLSTIAVDKLTTAQRRDIVIRGTDAVFKQCLDFGLFHADPHPGNIFLLPGNKLCFIDCGMTGQLDKRTMESLIDLVTGIIRGNLDRLGQVVVELTDADPAITTRREFRAELQHLINQVQGSNLEKIDITTLLQDFFAMLRRFRIHCPGDLLLLTKALSVIESVAEKIDPGFDVINHVEPQIRELVAKRYSYSAIRDRMLQSMGNYLKLFEGIPDDLHQFLHHLRRSTFTLNLEMERIELLANKIDMASRIMALAMIIAALIVGSSILILADHISQEHGLLKTIGLVGLILAGLYSAGFVISFLLPKKRK
ncbi:MAG: AarF/UbiB family protein [Desulfocapsaceae bacterium]|nr:AarF/UbiB family protein [Desulfocapsaceae bacterium]